MAGVAVVTGADRGSGREVARQLAAGGWAVVLGARDQAAGEGTAASVRPRLRRPLTAVVVVRLLSGRAAGRQGVPARCGL